MNLELSVGYPSPAIALGATIYMQERPGLQVFPFYGSDNNNTQLLCTLSFFYFGKPLLPVMKMAPESGC